MSNRNKNSSRSSRRNKQQIPQQQKMQQKKEKQSQKTSGSSNNSSDSKNKEKGKEGEETNSMKLIVRSKYWGRKLEGKVRRSQANPEHGYRVISCQAIADKIGESGYWGCCPHHGRRVLALTENHFVDHFPGQWDLYFVGAIPASGNIYHELFLLPREQSDVDVERHVVNDGWKKMGTIDANMARLGLSEILDPFMKENKELQRHKHHVHIQILMDQAIDREITRSKGKKSKSTNPKDTDREPNSPPLIPRAVSHDSSWANDTASNATQTTMTEDGWMSHMFFSANQYWGDADSQCSYAGPMLTAPPMAMNHQQWSQMQMQMQVPFMPTHAGMVNNGFLVPGAALAPPSSMPVEGYPVGFVDPTYWEEGESVAE